MNEHTPQIPADKSYLYEQKLVFVNSEFQCDPHSPGDQLQIKCVLSQTELVFK